MHAKVAEEIDLEMCSYGQLLEVQMLRDLDLDFGSGQGHTGAHMWLRSTHTQNYMEIGKKTFCGRTYGRTDGHT